MNGLRQFQNIKQRFNGQAGPLPIRLVEEAEAMFAELIETSAEPVLVHGDLHHDNILYSKKHGWIAIDPKGVAAEPAYEVAAMVRNPYEKLRTINNLGPLVTKRIDILAEELGYDRERIIKWSFVQNILSAVWSVDGVKGPEHALRVAEVIRSKLM